VARNSAANLTGACDENKKSANMRCCETDLFQKLTVFCRAFASLRHILASDGLSVL